MTNYNFLLIIIIIIIILRSQNYDKKPTMRYKVKHYESYEFENSELPHNFDLVCQFHIFVIILTYLINTTYYFIIMTY